MAICCSSSFGLSRFCNDIFDSSSDHLAAETTTTTTTTLSFSSRYKRGNVYSSSSSSTKRTGRRFQIRSSSSSMLQQQQPNDESNSIDMTAAAAVGSSLAAEGKPASSSSSEKDSRVTVEDTLTDNGGSFGGNDDSGEIPNGGGGRGGGGDGDGGSDDHEEEDNSEEVEFGRLMKFEEVIEEMKARGAASLPLDMLEAAKTVGIRKLLLSRYFDLQGSLWPLGFGMRYISWFRNRMLADPSFLFKVGIEVLIDSACATFAEVQKRGENFWAEFELFVADLLVGLVVDIALVGLLAPYARFGKPSVSVSKGFLGQMRRASATLPSSVFEAERPGSRFSVQQRVATYFYKGVLYGSVGFVCGLIGQGIANSIMTAKRSIQKSDEDIPVPPLVKSAALWGVFLAVSSNTRYQIINGLERLVEASPLAKKVPPAAMAFTVGVRFANNVYGGMQFVDWARLSGCQ